MKPCQIDGCEKPRKVRARWCSMHAARYYRHGDFDTVLPTPTPDHLPTPPTFPPPIDRLLARCELDGECWVCTYGVTHTGYCSIPTTHGRKEPAHRVSYEYFRAEIPEGLVIDHLCRNPRCVNPWHLEPVTHSVNLRRGARHGAIAEGAAALREADRPTVCPNGHVLSDVGRYYPKRQGPICAECAREDTRRRRARRKAA